MKIDFVIPWVDGNDPEWIQDRNLFCGNKEFDESRYRDWGTLPYWFRSVEAYAPWVNKIYFITYGHIPEWLNRSHPKLKIISHKDYIPEEYLPTFNSNTIELNLHRIEGLSEHFVYFNDDTFLNAPVLPEDFFQNGLPCNCAVLEPFVSVGTEDPYPHILLNDMSFLNRHFVKHAVIKKYFFKWYHPVYGKYILKNIYFAPGKYFSGLRNLHIPSSMTKSTYRKVWNMDPELLHNTCKHKFRREQDVNQNIMSYYDICSGSFAPRSAEFGKCYGIGQNNKQLFSDLKREKHKLICINDHPFVADSQSEKEALLKHLQNKLPDKSSYER